MSDDHRFRLFSITTLLLYNTTMKKKILVYAFSAWGKNNRNLSETVLQELKLPLEKHLFKVRFDQKPFLDLLNNDISHIIGLGQYPTGKYIRIEQVAHNIYGTKQKGYQSINEGPICLTVDLKLKPTSKSHLTYNAGKFVCNFSMYTILYHKHSHQKFAFLHIPKKLEDSQAVSCVAEIIQQIV